MRIYLDTNVFIPAVEGSGRLQDILKGLLEIGDEHAGLLVTSELTLAEVLVIPLEQRQTEAVTTYLELIASRPGLDVVPVSRNMIILAAHIRSADKTIRLPDAIHLATAQAMECSHLISGDEKLRRSGMAHVPVNVESIERLIGELT